MFFGPSILQGSVAEIMKPNSFIESTNNQSYKVFKSRMSIEIWLFLLAFRAICFRYGTVTICVNCPHNGARRPEC
jgi:hypothetical protein